MLNSTHTFVSPTPTTLEGYLLEFESSISVSFVSEYSRKSLSDRTENTDVHVDSLSPTKCYVGGNGICLVCCKSV